MNQSIQVCRYKLLVCKDSVRDRSIEKNREKERVSVREKKGRDVKTLAYVFIRNSIRKFCQKKQEKIQFKVCTQSTDRNRISIDPHDRFFSILPPRHVNLFPIHNTYNIIYYGLISDQTPRNDSRCDVYFIGILLGTYISYSMPSTLKKMIVVTIIIIIYLLDFLRIQRTFLPSYYFHLFIFFILIRSSI